MFDYCNLLVFNVIFIILTPPANLDKSPGLTGDATFWTGSWTGAEGPLLFSLYQIRISKSEELKQLSTLL